MWITSIIMFTGYFGTCLWCKHVSKWICLYGTENLLFIEV